MQVSLVLLVNRSSHLHRLQLSENERCRANIVTHIYYIHCKELLLKKIGLQFVICLMYYVNIIYIVFTCYVMVICRKRRIAAGPATKETVLVGNTYFSYKQM